MRVVVMSCMIVASACRTAPQLRVYTDSVRSEIDRAKRAQALRCAPVELATAEANFEFLLTEIDQADGSRGWEHLLVADAAARKAVSMSRECSSRLGEKKEMSPIVVKIDEGDRDSDQVGDRSDKCPNESGPPENQGCPVVAPVDRDGDGIADASDRCVDQSEDVDGFEDSDGCPELDNDADGVVDSADQCATIPGPVSNQGCPLVDDDSDGLSDAVDACPNEPEDVDGFEDNDGCPELDNDNDGVPDDRDACPMQGGAIDSKGCPATKALVQVQRDRIEIKKQIKFASASAQIVGTESGQVLGEVAQALKEHPEIKKLRIEGHTDSLGDDIMNLKLSEARAAAVQTALIRLGIDPSRLESVGYGEAKPLASNDTSAGRKENRRTDLRIVEP